MIPLSLPANEDALVPLEAYTPIAKKKKKKKKNRPPRPDMRDAAPEDLSVILAKSGMTMRMWYRKVYLKSLHWSRLRFAKIKKTGRGCEKCGVSKKRGIYHVHHLVYRQIFDVTLDDLQVLCEKCHRGEHDNN